ncbi:MAG: aldehyde dehydrogenase family protein [Ignavibacteriales bacterium]|nr:aldehyde dehydrogenase family protein [Ignavibacteriales bacterium]
MSNFTESYNPATGELIGKTILNSADDVKRAVDNASAAQSDWTKLSVRKRARIVLKMRDYIVRNSEAIAEVISKDNGKTKIDALATEVMPAAMAISYYCKNADWFLSEEHLRAGNIFLINKRSKIERIPFGVIGIISPWNYPFAIPLAEIVMGLLAGNAVVVKVATETQIVGEEIRKAVQHTGLPDGLFTMLNLPGKIAGDAFLDSGIDKLFFTGSVPVGKYLMKKASETLTPVSLELGGNDAMIVCEDADPYRAAMGALWAGFQNAGQSCGGVERIYVHEKVYDKFMNVLKEKVENLRVKNGFDFNSDMGCLTTQKQVETVNLHVKDALYRGAKIFAQSKIPDETNSKNYLPAMVLTDVNHEMLVMKDETFGPVVGVMKFSEYAEAVRLANDSNLGLTASVWSKSTSHAEKIAKQIKAGAVTINDHLMSHGLAETPWGGFKQSGIGRTHGKLGFDEMTQPMVIVKDILPFVKKDLWWHPFNKKLFDGLKGLLDLLYNKNLGKKVSGTFNLLKVVPRIFIKE